MVKAGDSGRNVSTYVFTDKLSETEKAKASGHSPKGAAHREGEILDKALRQSEDILNLAREEGEKLKEEARQEGYAVGLVEGKKAGYETALKEHGEQFAEDRRQVRAEIEAVIQDMKEKKEELLDKYLDDLKNIAVAVAEKVIRVSLKSSSETIKVMITSATGNLKKREWAKIYISKYDADMMVEGDAEFLNALSYLSDNVKIITMENEEQGACIVELPDEIIDLSVSTQMSNIRDILNNA